MFRAKTVIVLGAGASCEVGLPDGRALLESIRTQLTYRFDFDRPRQGDGPIFEALKLHVNEGHEVAKLNAHLNAAAQISRAAAQAISIDNVIDMLEDPRATVVGKIAIAKNILAAESHSAFFRTPEGRLRHEIDIQPFKGSWYSRLTQLLTEQIRVSSTDSVFENLKIVNFNYDRCLEQYLAFSLSDYFGLNIEEGRQLVDKLPVHRPYGRVGKLPWQSGDEPRVEFGSTQIRDIQQAASQLRTFTEQVASEAQDAITSTLFEADRVVFLGFAFHRQNTQLLRVERDHLPDVVATSYGVSKSDQVVIRNEITEAFGGYGIGGENYVELHDGKCIDLFDQYWRTLTASAPEH